MLTDTTVAARLGDYRSGVEDLVRGYEVLRSSAEPAGRELTHGERHHLHTLLRSVPGFPTDIGGQLDHELRAFHPTARSNASSAATLLRILLLQQIDVLWWGTTAPFVDDDAVRTSG